MIIYFIKIKNSISAVAHVKFGTHGNTLAQQTEQIIEIFGKDYVSLDELILFKGKEIECKEFNQPGSAVVFPSFTNHKVNKLSSGKRHTLAIWMTGPKFR